MKIFLYGFIAIVSLIGITNIFNTVTTGMELRGKEFAMLQSIGMTKKEFDKMIRLESVFYGSKALIIGVVSGTILSYVIYISAGESQLKYTLPLLAIVMSVIICNYTASWNYEIFDSTDKKAEYYRNNKK